MPTTCRGKNVLIFDLETTGIPMSKKRFSYDKDSYFKCTDNTKYNNSRIVSLAWTYIENYDRSKIDLGDISHHIRKPIDFNEIPNSNLHGITFDYAKKKGTLLSKIINDTGFGYAILNCDVIIGHNVLFDLHVLLNELYRIKFEWYTDKLCNILKTDKYFCTMHYGKNVCKINNKYGYKMPKLSELFNHYYNKQPVNMHTANGDVKTLLMILQKINI